MEAAISGSAASEGSREKAGAKEASGSGSQPPVASDGQSQGTKSMSQKETERSGNSVSPGRARGSGESVAVATDDNARYKAQKPVAVPRRSPSNGPPDLAPDLPMRTF